MKSHQAMRHSRSEARRRLAALRTTSVGARHDTATFDLVEVHRRFIEQETDEDE